MILITGGTGFIGSHTVAYLAKKKHRIRILAHHAHLPSHLLPFHSSIEMVLGDLNDRQTLERAMEKAEYVVHLAWTTVPKNATDNPSFDVQSNVIGTIHLLEAAVKYKVKKIVFISSGGTVYGIPQSIPIPETHPLNPISAYGVSKMMAEKYIQLYYHLYKLDYAILRVANCYGTRQNLLKGQGVIGIWLQKILNNEAIEVWGDGSIERDYIHVSDVARAIETVLSPDISEKIFNLGQGESVSLNQLVKIMQEVTKQNVCIRHLPKRGFDVPQNSLAIEKICQNTDWKPQKELKQGVFEVWEWLKKHTQNF